MVMAKPVAAPSFVLAVVALVLVVGAAGCGASSPRYRPPLHGMGGFRVPAGEQFLQALAGHDTITIVSIIDCSYVGHYQVNRRSVFADTIQQEYPNLKSYRTMALELGLAPDDLLSILRTFEAMQVNEFRRYSDYDFLQVAVGFTRDRGYIHLHDPEHASAGYVPYWGQRLRLVHELAPGWFEVEGAPPQ